MNDKLPNNDNPSGDKSQLREQMWDLVYGLLEQDESRDLITRIKSDPQAARLYAEVRLQADLVGYASQVEDSSLVLTGDSAAREVAPAAGKRHMDKAAAALGRSRSGNILAGIVAAALALLIGVGIFWPQVDQQKLADGFAVINIESLRDMPGGITSEVPVRIAGVDGVGQMAEGEATVYDAEGIVMYRGRFGTNDIGVGTVTIPGEAMQPGAKLKVAAVPVDASRKELAERDVKASESKHLDDLAKLESTATSLYAELPVREEPQMQYFFSASPVNEPGQANQFAVWNLRTFSATPAPADFSGAAVEDLAGVAVSEPMWTTDGTVGTGEYSVPKAGDSREMRLEVTDKRGDRFRAPLDGIVMQPFRQSAKAEARKDSESYGLALKSATGERAWRDNAPGGSGGAGPRGGEPSVAQLAESAPAAAALPAAPPAPAKPAESEKDIQNQLADNGAAADKGYAAGNAAPAQQPANSLDRAVAVDKYENEALQEVLKEAEDKVASKVVTYAVPAQYASKPLNVRILYRGVEVAKKSLEAGETTSQDVNDGRDKQEASYSFALNLPPEVRGPVAVELYDGETDELLRREVVVRQSPRKLYVKVKGGKPSYAPGETVSLTLEFTDENGKPAARTQGGVRVWNEQVVQSLGDRPLLLADALQADTNDLAERESSLALARSYSGADAKVQNEALAAIRTKAQLEQLEQKPAMSSAEAKKADAAKRPAAEEPANVPALDTPRPESVTAAPEAAKAGSEGLVEESQRNEGLAGAGLGDARLGGDGFGGGSGNANYYADDLSETNRFQLEKRYGEADAQTASITNNLLVQAEYEAAKRQAEDAREARQATIGRILLFGGIGAVALLGVLMLLKLPTKARIVVPSLAIAAASVVLGLGWIGMRPGTGLQQVAMVDEHGGIDHAKPAARPMATSAVPSEPQDRWAMDADGHDPAGLAAPAAAAGSAPSSSDFSRGTPDFGASNSPAHGFTPSAQPGDDAPTPLSAADAPTQFGAGGYAAPEGGAAKFSPGRGGASGPASGGVVRKSANRPENAELSPPPASLRPESVEATLAKQAKEHKPALQPIRDEDRNLQDGAKGRGGGEEPSFAKPKAMRSIAPAATAPTPAAPGAGGKPAAAGLPAGTPAPIAPIVSAADEKDSVREPAGQVAKEATRQKSGEEKSSGKPLFAETAEPADNEETKNKTDGFGTYSRRSLAGGLRNAGDAAASSEAPASIYFNPRLIADDNGRATIEFTMPPVESEYRLLIDALGSGRIGSLQQVIECKQPAK